MLTREQIIKSGRDIGDYWSTDEELIEMHNERIADYQHAIVKEMKNHAFKKVKEELRLELQYVTSLYCIN